MRQQGVEAIRRQANARAEQLGEILSDFAGESANATAKALRGDGERNLNFAPFLENLFRPLAFKVASTKRKATPVSQRPSVLCLGWL